jgi:hypothetical protein
VSVVAIASARQILVTNRTNNPIFPFVIGRNALPATDYVMCVDPSRCRAIEPGSGRMLPYPGPYNGVAETEAVVMWWGSMRDSTGTFRAVNENWKVVRL